MLTKSSLVLAALCGGTFLFGNNPSAEARPRVTVRGPVGAVRVTPNRTAIRIGPVVRPAPRPVPIYRPRPVYYGPGYYGPANYYGPGYRGGSGFYLNIR